MGTTRSPAADQAAPAPAGRVGIYTRAMSELREARTLPLRTEQIIFAIILCIGTLLRLMTLTQDSLWVDEGYSLAASGLSLGHMWSVPFDTHPPLHFTLVKLADIFTSGELAVRLPSAVFAIATLGVFHLLARRAIGPVGALVATAALALSFTHLVHASNGRGYAVLVFFLLVAMHAGVILRERLLAGAPLNSRAILGWAALYIGAAIGAMTTHNTGVLFLFTLSAALCAWTVLAAPRETVGFTIRMAAINAIALLIVSPWLLTMLSTSGAFDWLAQQSPVEAAHTLAVIIGPNRIGGLAALAVLGVAGLGMLIAVLRAPKAAFVIAVTLIAFPALIWVFGYLMKPIYMERVILPALIGGALSIGVVAAHIRRDWAAATISVAALGLMAVSAVSFITRPASAENLGAHVLQDWRGAIADHDSTESALLICDTFTFAVVDEYRADSDLIIHNASGDIWQMTMIDWRELYGQPAGIRTDKSQGNDLPWLARATRGWDETLATHNRVIFLKADILCNDGEPEILREKLAQSGFRHDRTDDYVGVSAEVFVRN